MLHRYVSGDFRFRASYSKHNPRKMVKVWAEKERRNLVRLQAAGIRSPQPLQLRSHVLIMAFIGTDGVAAPRLKVHICTTSNMHAQNCSYVQDQASMQSSPLPVPVCTCCSAVVGCISNNSCL